MTASNTNPGRIFATIALIVVLLLGIIGYVGWYKLFRVVPQEPYPTAEEHFKYGSIGNEAQEGIPYWIWLVMPRIFPEKLPAPGGYTSLGMTWEEGKELPVGFSKKTIGFPRVGATCALCHNATYRTSRFEKPEIIVPGPANKLNLQGYVRFLGDAASDPKFNADVIMNELKYYYDFSWLDKLLYRFIIIPQTKKALIKQKQEFAWMDSRPDWGPGRIEAFNPIKFRLLKLPVDDTIGTSDLVPLWNEKQHEGFAFHWDGSETSLSETVQTGVIGNGVSKDAVNLADIERVENFIKEVPAPKYPFAINQELAAQGSKIFDSNCASCHAFGGERTGSVIPVEEVGTDRYRVDMWTQQAADEYKKLAKSYSFNLDNLHKTNGYLSVSLEGLWLRAPYLHNGSVPSLPDLLEKPENRPQVFYRGYDVYNPDQVGFVSEGKEAEKFGFKYDTSVAGNSNQGHTYGTDLSAQDKQKLIEYLKTL